MTDLDAIRARDAGLVIERHPNATVAHISVHDGDCLQSALDRRALLAEVDRLRAVRLEASESHVWLEGAATERARIRAAVEDEYEKVKKSLPLAAVLAAIDRGER